MHLTPPHVFCGRLWRGTPRFAVCISVTRNGQSREPGSSASIGGATRMALMNGKRSAADVAVGAQREFLRLAKGNPFARLDMETRYSLLAEGLRSPSMNMIFEVVRPDASTRVFSAISCLSFLRIPPTLITT
jgi:hypothetical protein